MISFPTVKSIITGAFVLIIASLQAQEKKEIQINLTLPQAIEIAKQQSISSFRYKNMYLERYWAFRSYKAERLPGLSLRTSPLTYNQSYQFDNSQKKFIPDRSLNSTGSLSLNQNLAFSGGTIGVVSSLQRYENFIELNPEIRTDFVTRPMSIVLSQPISGYNEFKWNARIEPLKFEIAKREFVQSIEDVSLQANQYFFNAATAEINLNIAETNFHNADTLFRIAKGRFEIGTVTQDELLDFELSFLNAKIDLTKANLNLRQARSLLNSFLRLDENVIVKCIIPTQITKSEIDVDKALTLSIENNPQMISFKQRLLEAQQSVSSAKARTGLNASLNANLGLDKKAFSLQEAYADPFRNNQGIGVTLSVPILDWGARKGKIQMAKSLYEVREAEVEQSKIDFQQNVFQQIMEYNLQDEQVEIAAKADTIAQLGYDVTKQRFMIDKVDVIKLNMARNSLDAAKRNYIDALRRYWAYHFTIRKLTLYDFENDAPLMQTLDQLLEKND